MILLDTNVVSEPLKKQPDPRVLAWLDAQDVGTLYLAAITLAELRYGVASLPAGKRRTSLHDHLEQRVLPLFNGRMLPFDEPASRAYANLRAQARGKGLAISNANGYIAATAVANGLTVATRDTQPFVAAGLEVIDPWSYATSRT